MLPFTCKGKEEKQLQLQADCIGGYHCLARQHRSNPSLAYSPSSCISQGLSPWS